MIMKKWDELPEEIKNDKTKKYYDIISKKKCSLIVKRIFDISVSLILLILLSPIFLILAIAIKIDSKGPIFYRQERITQYGNIFKIFKFRTMIKDADKKGTLVTVSNDDRITRVGRVVRKYRLDEIPQLINILVGENGCGKTTILDAISSAILDYKAEAFKLTVINNIKENTEIIINSLQFTVS